MDELNPNRRRRSYIIPKRSWVERHPKLFVYTGTVVGLLILFSRPLYDAFIRTEFAPLPPPGERRAAILKQWKV